MADSEKVVQETPQPLKVPAAAEAPFCWECDNHTIDYSVRADHLDVIVDNDKFVGKMFSLTYTADALDGKPTEGMRPVTFAYNGGPGSASVPINFGGIGPVRVETDEVGNPVHPLTMQDNPATVLRDSDLVVLDALGTGYSVVAPQVEDKDVFGIDADANAFAAAIMQWLKVHNRWGSDIYLYGESYGTMRNAVLMRVLAEKGVRVTGVVMLSAIFDWAQTLPGNDLYYLGMVPTFAATAAYHGKAHDEKGAVVVDPAAHFEHAMKWCERVLAPALLQGDALEAHEAHEVAEQMAALIGLPKALIEKKHFRISLDVFRRELLADTDQVIGRLDTRYVSYAPSHVEESSDFFAEEDAAADSTSNMWNEALRMLLDELCYDAPARYYDNNYPTVGVNWNWNHTAPGVNETVGAPNVAFDIACAMRRDPHLRLCILGGYYDCATTYWNVLHDIAVLYLPEELKANIEFHLYPSGHMLYANPAVNLELGEDVSAFFK